MASLALLVMFIMLSLWGLAFMCVVLSISGMRLAGCILGCASSLAGAWLLTAIPHVPFLGMINIFAGIFSIWFYFRGEKEDE